MSDLFDTSERGVRLARRYIQEERYQAVAEFEQRLIGRGAIPDTNRLLVRRTRWLFQYAGAILLGIMVSFGAMLITFYVCNKIIHI